MDSKGHGDDITPGFYRYTAARSSATDAVGPRAEWVGYAPHSGYSGVDPKGVQGLLERYKGGTILVDEFADLSEEIQTLLLDVAEGKAVVPVGIKGKAFVPDVRLVFATNKDVQTHIRPDLLDRIAVRIALPPLRERTGDVFLVVSQRLGETNYRLDFRTWELFLRFDWPGNVRQLRTVVGNAVDRARTEGPDDRTSANRSGVTKPRKGRVVLPFGYFTADGLLAAVVARVSPDEDTAKRVVQKWLSDLLRGWGYKPRARSSRRSDTKGKQRSVPVPVKSLAKRMGELLDVMELNETVIREVKSLAKRMGELLGVSESTISRGRRGSADHPPAGASPPAEG
jgi:DNA-binding NtrC family response regulator